MLQGQLNLPRTPLAAYDANGVVFAVGMNVYQRINLYDTKNFDKEPFLHIQIEDKALEKISFPPRLPVMTSLAFSSNGKFLLVGTAGDVHYVIDAFDGVTLFRLVGHVGLERGKSGRESSMIPSRGISGEELTWTPDSKYVIGGSEDGKVLVWEIDEMKKAGLGEETATLTPNKIIEGHPSVSRCIKFNPRFAMMATASAELVRFIHQLSVRSC